MKTEEKIERGYLAGCIRYKDKCEFYFMPIAYWILDYSRYDLDYDQNKWSLFLGIIF